MRFRSPLLAIAVMPLALALSATPLLGQVRARRPMQVADIDGFRDVRDLAIASTVLGRLRRGPLTSRDKTRVRLSNGPAPSTSA